jgi:hypothetical protein
MDAIFIELPAFARHRKTYLNDDDYKAFQQMMLKNPESGDVIQGTGGLRKVRFEDKIRQKGKAAYVLFIIGEPARHNSGYSRFITKMNWTI